MRRFVRPGIALVALLLSLLVIPAAASADNTNPNGAQVLTIHDCAPDPTTGGQDCLDAHVVFQNENQTSNPAGISSFSITGRVCSTVIDSTGAAAGQFCQDVHEHVLVKDGTLQEEHQLLQIQEVTPSGTVCETINGHFANGQIQYQDFSTTPGPC